MGCGCGPKTSVPLTPEELARQEARAAQRAEQRQARMDEMARRRAAREQARLAAIEARRQRRAQKDG
jgi:hypothetical protein